MTIEPEEAARALRDAREAEGRFRLLEGYQRASAFPILWGLIWAACDLASYVSPAAGPAVWSIGDATGLLGSIILALRMQAGSGAASPWRRASAALMVVTAIVLFASGVSIIGGIRDFAQSQAVAGVAVGCAYIAIGAGRGVRIAAIGAAVIAITLGGWVYAREQFMLWMGLAGGGGLVLGGLWLRSV